QAEHALSIVNERVEFRLARNTRVPHDLAEVIYPEGVAHGPAQGSEVRDAVARGRCPRRGPANHRPRYGERDAHEAHRHDGLPPDECRPGPVPPAPGRA